MALYFDLIKPKTNRMDHIIKYLILLSRSIRYLVLLMPVMLAFLSCEPAYAPKPRAFFRISLPEKSYQHFSGNYPYSFEYPVYAVVRPDPFSAAEPYRVNVDIPQFSATLHISYKKINNNLADYLNDIHRMLSKQITKASGIREDMITNGEDRVYGTIYHIRGLGVASSCQFYVTDSTRHFLRGALYFNVMPNNDSLAPVIEFLKEDIQHLVSTLQWETPAQR